MKFTMPRGSNTFLEVGEVALHADSEKVYIGTAEGMKQIDPKILDESVLANIEAFKKSKGHL